MAVLWCLLAWAAAFAAPVISPEAPSEDPAEARAPEADGPVVVAISPFAPFATPDADGGPPTGFSIDLWSAVARAEGLEFSYVAFPNVAEKLGAVTAGEAGVAIGGISVTLERERDVDFSQATFRTGLDILVRHEPTSAFSARALMAAATPSRIGIIVGFFLLIVVSGHLVWLAERGKEAFDDRYIPGVFEGMYWAIVTASTVGYGDKAPVRWAGRLVAALVIVVSLPMFAVFTAELASTLTVATLESQIGSEDDLRNKAVGVVQGTTGERAMKDIGARVFPFPNAGEATKALVAGDVVAVVHDAPNLFAIQQASGDDLLLVGNLFEPQLYGIAVQQGSPLRERVNRGLLSVQESGEWDAIRTRWFEGDLGE